MNLSSQTHKVIAFISLIMLSYLQFNLLYKTYELKNNQYILKERQVIRDNYEASIRNDKLYPGGQKIVDAFIYGNLAVLERNYLHDPAAFAQLKQKICDSIIIRLRSRSNMDSVFNGILKKNRLDKQLKYLLALKSLAITLNGTDYISIYNNEHSLTHLAPSIQTQHGAAIDGTLEHPMQQSLTSALMVSSGTPRSYSMGFALYVDHDNRKMTILKSMSSSLFLSVCFIFMVTCIYYFTYRNWLRQKKLSNMKSDFLNSITHEFNTPITTILVANSSIQNKEIIEDKEKVYPLTDVIKRQAQRLQELVNQALDVSQMNRETVEKEPHDIGLLLEELISDYRLKIAENVRIMDDVPQLNCVVLLNRFLLTTMLYNIFDNAIKYNTQAIKEIKITATEREETLHICIGDNGVGMKRDLIRSVFDKFYRGKNGIETRGLGLGLFYVKQGLEAHDWKLDLTSELNQGSNFCIIMPIEKDRQ